VMASAALRGGGVVYTGDVDDLRRLQRHFPTVVVLAVCVLDAASRSRRLKGRAGGPGILRAARLFGKT
jgi:hypothetical protein